MDAAAELGNILVSKHQIQPEYGNEQVDAGWDYQILLARPNSQARTRTGKKIFFPVQLTTSKISHLTRLIHTLAICETIQTYIHIPREAGFKILAFVCNDPKGQH